MKKQILILLMLFSIAFVSAQVPQAEKDALIALYDATNGADWRTNTNWKTNEPVNTWYGVTVENGHIISLQLDNNNLVGELPNELVNLTNLNTLSIYYNKLQGKLPNLTSITTLENLTIHYNNFQFADFEDEFSTYKANLTRFYYAPMKNIGEEITHDYVEGNTYTMTMLEVAGTNVTYQWYKNDELIAGATSLTYTITNAQINDAANYTCKASSAIVTDLLISRKPIHIYGKISTEQKNALIALYNATNGDNWTNKTNWNTNEPVYKWYGVYVEGTNVTKLFLSHNNLSGNIPVEIGNLTSLKTLSITNNLLSGNIPAEIGNLNNLEFLLLFKNQLSGAIPAEIGNLTSLNVLELQHNKLSGSLPTEIENLIELTYLSLEGNELSGVISSKIGSLINLRHLYLSGNKLSGSIPSEIGNLINLKNLSLSNNEFSGSIPSEIGNLINLENLYLGGNKLSGSIPSAIGNLINLKNLSLSNNEFSGSIPSEIGNLINLENLYLGGNKLSGSIPSAIGNLVQLEDLSLSNNQLSGSLPTTMGNLTALKRLFLESNFFTGNLPTEFQNLTAITYLYLYGNQFSGDIPNIFTNWTELSQLVLETMIFNNSAKTNNFSGTLDVTNNLKLYACLVDNNNLSTIKINNGNNTNIRFFEAKNNPNLTCIFVDDKVYSAANWTNIDATSRFVETQAQCNADYTYVPDDNFEQALIDLGHDDVLDNYVLTSSINTVTELDVDKKNISNLTGIEDFTELKKLTCWNNPLNFLNVTNNIKLTHLACGNDNTTSLDVSKNTELETLYCGTSSMTSIDLSNNKKLRVLATSNAPIGNLDVSNNKELFYLQCINNNLSSIDVSMLNKLRFLNCDENQIKELDVSKNPLLEDMFCKNNQLTSLDVSNNPIERFIASNNPLTELNMQNGNNTNVTLFEATSVPNLTCIYVDNASYSKTNWTNIDATSTFVETQAQCNALYTYVPDDNFEQVLIDLGYDNVLDNYVPTSHINTVTTLDVNQKNISDLTGIEDFVELKELICANNSIYSLDVSNNVKLTYLFCSNNFLNSLDVSKNTELETLYCSSLSITSIDLSNNKKLRALATSNAPIGNLDVSNNKELFYLQCVDNNLSSLNVSMLDKLGYLWCGKNQIKELDLSNNPLLYDVFCENNQLTSLDLSNNPIKRLRVVNNPLTELNMQNGNNTNVTLFAARNVPNLTCIYVDDANYSKTNWTNIDATSTFVETQDECSSLSVAENTFSSKNISVYPNPTNQFLNINSYTNIQKIIIYDVLGKKVLATKNTSKINVSQLKVGMYLLSIKTTEGKTINKQFVKQ